MDFVAEAVVVYAGTTACNIRNGIAAHDGDNGRGRCGVADTEFSGSEHFHAFFIDGFVSQVNAGFDGRDGLFPGHGNGGGKGTVAGAVHHLVADEIVAAATGVDPTDPAGNPEGIIQSNVDAIANNAAVGTTNIQTDAIGKVNRVAAFSTPTNDNELVQYILTKVVDSTDVEHDTDVRVSGINQKATVHDATLVGWDIKVRVYYKMVGSGDYRVVDVSAFAPRDINVY